MSIWGYRADELQQREGFMVMLSICKRNTPRLHGNALSRVFTQILNLSERKNESREGTRHGKWE
jgi:hypothetical protein